MTPLETLIELLERLGVSQGAGVLANGAVFARRMVAWSPEFRNSVEELIDGLQLSMKRGARHKRRKLRF